MNDENYRDVLSDLSDRLTSWMSATSDPLLDGPVPIPPGAIVNRRDGVNPEDLDHE